MGAKVTTGSSGVRGKLLLSASAVVVLVYAAIGATTLTVGQLTGLASPVWPSAGVAFAAAYVWGWRIAPAIVIGSIASNGVTLLRQEILTPQAVAVVFIVGIGAAAQAVLGAYVVRRMIGSRAPLTGAREIVLFLLIGGPIAAMVAASIATSAQVGFGLISPDQALSLWVTWWTGDSIGVIIFAPITLMFIPEQSSVWQQRRLKVALPALIGLGLFLALFIQSDAQEALERSLRLEQMASSAAGTLERNVARHQEALEGLSGFFDASDVVDVEEFQTYSEDVLERFPNLQAISWNPLLSRADLVDFEEYQRTVQGLSDFQVTERNAEGELVPASVREEYVPVGYIEPLSDNEAALGFDINSDPTREMAIDRARTSGVPSATGPIDLVQGSDSQKGMLALVPISKANDFAASGSPVSGELTGFAVGVYRLGDLLEESFAGSMWDHVDVELVDVTNGVPGEEVAYRPAKLPPTIDRTTAEKSAQASYEFDVYGRDWQLEVLPTSGPLTAYNRTLPLNLSLLGLAVLTLLMAFVLLVTGLERVARRQATQATREANTDSLTGLQNRRAFLDNLQRFRERSVNENTHGVLMYIDLDDFKQVNDRAGHEAGDDLLRKVAAALSGAVRSRDVVARLGGDEFAIVVNDCGLERGIEIGRGIESAVRSVAVTASAGPIFVGVSIGLTAINPEDGYDIDALLRRADDASYAAKRAGGGIRVAGEGFIDVYGGGGGI